MKELDTSILPYQEGTNVPSIVWKVIFRTPPPDDVETPEDHDVSERLMNDPNIVDTAEYRENLTYINEVGLKLNNGDKSQTSESGTGLLDGTSDIEVFIDGYFDIPGGSAFPIRKFGGWVDRDRLKTDSVKGNCEVVCYSYFGKAEKVSGPNVSTKYIDENGLRLYTAKVWVRDANISGKELQKGLHYITTVFDTNPKAKLDDGDYVLLTFDDETILSNADDTEQVKVYYSGFDHADERTSTLIVKAEEQYPYTYFYYGTLPEIIKQCFAAIGISSTVIESYEIETFDNRYIISGSNKVDNTFNQFIPIAIEFNGIDRFYISGANTGSPNKNQIWEYNRTTGGIRLIYETTLNDSTHFKLVYDQTEEVLLAFMDGVEFEDPGFIQKILITDTGISNVTILNDTQYDFVNSNYRFHYSKYLQKFLYLGMNGGNKTFLELTLNGVETALVADANFELDGCSFIYESGSTVSFYYVKNDAGTRKLYKRVNSSGWSETLVATWFDQADYNNWYGLQFLSEGKVFISNSTVTRMFDVTANTFTSDLTPSGVKIHSPFESDGKLFVMTYDVSTDIQRLASFESDTLSYESEDIIQYDIIKTPVAYGFQHICEYSGNELTILSKFHALMLRFSDKFIPFIEGEYDTSGKTVREILQDFSNNFLGYVKLRSDKVGYFVSRKNYSSDDVFTLGKNFIKERVTERVYSEQFDRIEISNGTISAEYGDRRIDGKVKSLTLPLIPNGYQKDFAKYFLDYYSVSRKIIKIKYLPTFYNYESLDQADLSDVGLGTGKIHKVSPKKNSCEFEIII